MYVVIRVIRVYCEVAELAFNRLRVPFNSMTGSNVIEWVVVTLWQVDIGMCKFFYACFETSVEKIENSAMIGRLSS